MSTIQERACGGSGPPRAAPTPLLGQPLPWSPTPGPAKAAVSWGRECLWSRSCRQEEAGSGGRDWHTKELISNERLPPASRIRSPDSTSPGTAGATSIHSQAKRCPRQGRGGDQGIRVPPLPGPNGPCLPRPGLLPLARPPRRGRPVPALGVWEKLPRSTMTPAGDTAAGPAPEAAAPHGRTTVSLVLMWAQRMQSLKGPWVGTPVSCPGQRR